MSRLHHQTKYIERLIKPGITLVVCDAILHDGKKSGKCIIAQLYEQAFFLVAQVIKVGHKRLRLSAPLGGIVGGSGRRTKGKVYKLVKADDHNAFRFGQERGELRVNKVVAGAGKGPLPELLAVKIKCLELLLRPDEELRAQ